MTQGLFDAENESDTSTTQLKREALIAKLVIRQ